MKYQGFLCLAMFLTGLATDRCALADAGFQLEGLVVQSSPAFDAIVPLFSTASVRLILDGQSIPTGELSGCDCESYRHSVSNGFAATFTTLHVRSDSYLVEVTNDYAQDGGADIVRFSYLSTSASPADAPLVVNGSPFEFGSFSLLLKDQEGTAITGSAIPVSLNLNAFETKLVFLKDHASPLPAGVPDIVASLMTGSALMGGPGDFDLDGNVDGTDFLEWQEEFGSEGVTAADANHNFIVDSADLDVWMTSFGAGETSGIVAVPEPARLTLVLCLVGAMLTKEAARFNLYASK